MRLLEDHKTRQNPKRSGTRNPTQNFVAKVCERLSSSATHILYATVQYSNPRIQASVHDYVAQQPMYRRKKFQKIKIIKVSKTLLQVQTKT